MLVDNTHTVVAEAIALCRNSSEKLLSHSSSIKARPARGRHAARQARCSCGVRGHRGDLKFFSLHVRCTLYDSTAAAGIGFLSCLFLLLPEATWLTENLSCLA